MPVRPNALGGKKMKCLELPSRLGGNHGMKSFCKPFLKTDLPAPTPCRPRPDRDPDPTLARPDHDPTPPRPDHVPDPDPLDTKCL